MQLMQNRLITTSRRILALIAARWRAPAAVLAVILQRTPAVRVASEAASFVLESPAASVLRAGALAAAALGAVDTVAGASTSTTTMVADVTVPATVAIGQAFKMDVTVSGPAVTFAKSWDVTNTLPPGIAVQGATLSGSLWVINDATAAKGVLTISGSPTSTGTFSFTANAYMGTNRTGSTISGATSITVVSPSGTAPSISAQPASQTVNAGSSAAFSVTANASPLPTYQWEKDGTPIAGATKSSLFISPVQLSDAGSYSVVVTNTAGSVTSATAVLTVNAVTVVPSFTAQPASQTIAAGSTVFFTAAATGAPVPTYQWYLNGAAVPGATGPDLLLSGAGLGDAGVYTCVATNSGGGATSAPATLSVVSTPDIGRLVNISCRAGVGTGGNILIAGFTVGGSSVSGTENLLVRASGPALGELGLSGFLPDPLLQLYSGSMVLGLNSGWLGDASVAGASSSVGAFPWLSPTSHDSALLEALSPGGYTANISGQAGDTGVALAEVYDATPAGSYNPGDPRIVNISARVNVGTGNNVLIAGFAIGGSTARTVLIRASGPALTQFKVPGTLPDPVLQLYNASSRLIISNSAWGGNPVISAAAASVGAFTWSFTTSGDCAILITLPPGTYSAVVYGASNDTGVALVEVYEVP